LLQKNTSPAPQYALPSEVIVDQYIIERVIAQGGFSTVYLARQINDQQQVVIKEYQPASLTKRVGANVVALNDESKPAFQHGLKLFIEEAKLLATLKHPNIVNVQSFFLANKTAYLVMNHEYGFTLGHWLRNTKEAASDDFLLTIFPAVMRCIKNMHHRGFLHLDIKPDNILLRPEDNPLILDFGAAMPFKKPSDRPPQMFTRGYSAPEQHSSTSSQLGPWSDIYSIAVSMRACLDKQDPLTPPITPTIPSTKQYRKKNNQKILQAIDWGMQENPKKRPQSMDEFIRALQYL